MQRTERIENIQSEKTKSWKLCDLFAHVIERAWWRSQTRNTIKSFKVTLKRLFSLSQRLTNEFLLLPWPFIYWWQASANKQFSFEHFHVAYLSSSLYTNFDLLLGSKCNVHKMNLLSPFCKCHWARPSPTNFRVFFSRISSCLKEWNWVW